MSDSDHIPEILDFGDAAEEFLVPTRFVGVIVGDESTIRRPLSAIRRPPPTLFVLLSSRAFLLLFVIASNRRNVATILLVSSTFAIARRSRLQNAGQGLLSSRTSASIPRCAPARSSKYSWLAAGRSIFNCGKRGRGAWDAISKASAITAKATTCATSAGPPARAAAT